MYMSSKKPTETTGDEREFLTDGAGDGSVRLIPSSSEDLTLASITSETNGRNTTILNVTEKQIR